METKALRVFYRKLDNQIVWTYQVIDSAGRTPVTFPTPIDLAEIPSKMPDGVTPLGGIADDYDSIEIQDIQKVDGFMASDDNSIVGGNLVIGAPRAIATPILARDLTKEIDELWTTINTIKTKVGM